ncbi:MAG: glucose-6-phosphate dehydrogenase [Pseudomonadota bacterium]
MAQFVPVSTFDLVIFGGTGDLAQRKLLPALFHRDRDGQFTDDSRIVAASRGEMTNEGFVDLVRQALETYLAAELLDDAVWARFSARLRYQTLDITTPDGWKELARRLKKTGDERTRVFYMATIPTLFGESARQISENGLIEPSTRIVLEKPVGSDRESAREINDAVGQYFEESQIYRIDHYLGKETVQNLSALRFANSLLEPLWNRTHIDHVQISVAEHIGTGNRAQFYNHTGALRDMVQNHMLQLLCLVAMEPPLSMNHDDVRNEKIKVLKALRPITTESVKRATARGQYAAGAVAGEAVAGYADELGDKSDIETFVAIRADIDNWRWSGTPFYLRTGKRLPTKSSEIVIQFRQTSHSIFPGQEEEIEPNRLIIRLQPNEGMMLTMVTKEPGPGGFQLRSLPLNLSFNDAYQVRYPDAYERLLMEVLRGNPALFMHRAEVDAAWGWIDGIIDAWAQAKVAPQSYAAGTWGPSDAIVLLDRDDRAWFEYKDD